MGINPAILWPWYLAIRDLQKFKSMKTSSKLRWDGVGVDGNIMNGYDKLMVNEEHLMS